MMTLKRIPRVNLNGTSREELIAQQLAVAEAADALDKALAAATPHGRDFQTFKYADMVTVLAIDEHRKVRASVEQIAEDARAIALSVMEQGKGGG